MNKFSIPIEFKYDTDTSKFVGLIKECYDAGLIDGVSFWYTCISDKRNESYTVLFEFIDEQFFTWVSLKYG